MISTNGILLILATLTVAVHCSIEDKRQNDGKLSEYLAKNMSLRDLKKKKKKKKSKSSKPNEGTGDTLCTNKSQEDALLAFKAGITSDPNNVMANWVAGGSVCNGSTSSWSGITCVGGLVTKLKLDSKELSGTMSPLIGCLSNATVIDLGVNDLSGTIPSSLGYLKALTKLSLDDNNFSGPILSNFGEMTSLKVLLLHSNNFTGEIPVTLGNATTLTRIDLDNNYLSGTIPSTLGNLSMLEELYLSQNTDTTGTLPSEVCDLTTTSGVLEVLITDCSVTCTCCTSACF